MTNFFLTSGHLGWAFFALIVFTGLWCLTIDLVWRVTRIGARRLAWLAFAGWVVGAGIILWQLATGL